MDRIIKSDTEETFQELGILNNIKQSDSLNNSQVSEENGELRYIQRYDMRRKPVDESSIMSDITEKRLKFFEDENQILVM